MKPSVGRIVHYIMTPDWIGHDGHCMAAIVTGIPSPADPHAVNLHVHIDDSGAVYLGGGGPVHFVKAVPHDEAKSPGTWHWPERVE